MQMSDSLIEQDAASPVVHPLQYRIEPVKWISRTVDHRQAENRCRKFGVTSNDFFDFDLVVFIVEPRENSAHPLQVLRGIGPEVGANIRFLGQGQGLQRTFFDAKNKPVGAIDVLAAENDDAWGCSAKYLHDVFCLTSAAEDAVDDDI